MSKILSQEEIDALLSSAAQLEAQRSGEATPAESVMLYNFRRPDRVSKDQIRTLHILHDRFARNVATSLSAYLRAVTDVSITSVEQFTYSEFRCRCPIPPRSTRSPCSRSRGSPRWSSIRTWRSA
jgi:flagellar motor switch protein FliM